MKRRLIPLAGFALIALVQLMHAQASAPAASGPGSRNYNPATEITVKGTIENVMQSSGRHGWSGIHLSLKADQGICDVHVGPASFVSAQQFTFSKGDSIEVTGSKTKMNGKEVVIARQITKDGKVITLRDEQGFPKWSTAASRNK